MLTTEKKAEVLVHFKEWSGGSPPNECTPQDIDFFVEDNYDGDEEVLAYLESI